MLYLHFADAAVLLYAPRLLISTFSCFALTLPRSVCNSFLIIISYCTEARNMCRCACMSACRDSGHRPHSLSNCFPGNSCWEATKTPVERRGKLFTALIHVMSFPCRAKRDLDRGGIPFLGPHARRSERRGIKCGNYCICPLTKFTNQCSCHLLIKSKNGSCVPSPSPPPPPHPHPHDEHVSVISQLQFDMQFPCSAVLVLMSF